MKGLIIQGSSRKDGNTSLAIEELRGLWSSDRIDLVDYAIAQYDYEHQYNDDDFIALMRQIVEYDVIVFATPVYWYAMSGVMKTFFDRITDCLKVEKELGRKLRGKKMAAISCGSESGEVFGFFYPFESSADYLGMDYLGHTHTWVSDTELTDEVKEIIAEFKNKLEV